MLRVGLGCMRLSTAADRDETRAMATIHAALAAGVTLFDTAHAYGQDDGDLGHNERLLGRALAGRDDARVVTKGGMRRPGGAWVPDGRARSLRADCAASREALGRPIDVYLLHAPDPRTSLATSVRALAELREAGWVRAVGLSNVSRTQLEEALAVAPVDAIEVPLSLVDDASARGGVLELAAARGLLVLAHSPLGGPRSAGRLARDPTLAATAAARGVTPGEVALAWLLHVHPGVVAIPGATRPETAAGAAAAASLSFDPDERKALAARFPPPLGARAPVPADAAGEVVLIMGLPGAGKSLAAAAWVGRGYERLNRDERGGTLKGIAGLLGERLAAGARQLVLDNTYLSRADRRDVVDAAHGAGVPVRCVWLDAPVAEAQANVVRRMLARHRRLLEPAELRRSREPGMLSPTSHFRLVRALEPPAADEGFAAVDVVRPARPGMPGGAGVFVAVDVLAGEDFVPRGDAIDILARGPAGPRLLFAWRPGRPVVELEALAARLGAATGLVVAGAQCAHGGGPPACWCRPPLPGLPLALAWAHGVDPAKAVLIGRSRAHEALAAAVGAEYLGA